MDAEFKKQLVEMAKAKGLNVAEDAADSLVELAIEVIGSIVKSSENTYDDMIWAAVAGKVTDLAKEAVDKIDGEKG